MRASTSQKQCMIEAYRAANGDKNLTIAVYASLDKQGIAPRESNVKPRDSKDYATILYHTARRLGWFDEA